MVLFQPLRDWVLVKRLEPDAMIGSLHIPGKHQEKAQRGEVMAVGRGVRTKKPILDASGAKHHPLIPLDVKPGDQICFGKYSGEDVHLGGEDYVTMREFEIVGLVLDPCLEWSQDELRSYLIAHGWKPEHFPFPESEPIPQGVKLIDFRPLTGADIRCAKELIAKHPEWRDKLLQLQGQRATAASESAAAPAPAGDHSESPS